MTIGQFLRTTAHNFRIFWRASFSGSGGPVMITGRAVGVEGDAEAEVEGDEAMAGNDEKAEFADAEAASAPLVDSEFVEPARGEHELDDSESAGGEAASALAASADKVSDESATALQTELQDVAPVAGLQADPGTMLEAGAAAVADPHAAALDTDATEATAVATPQGAGEKLDDSHSEDSGDIHVPGLDSADQDNVNEDSAGEANEAEDAETARLAHTVAEATLVQAALGIVENDDPLAADIILESHGRRLGLTQLIESLLFVSDEPVEAVQLAKALDVSLDAVNAGLQRLDKLYRLTGRGLRLQTREGHYQLITAPECAGAIEDFLNLDLTTKLSGPALETLAVIAYRQPVTRIQIEAVRGVDCAGVLRSMTQRGLIEEVGRLETVGRPILYGVTDLFMQHFGLTAINDLPPLEAQDEDMLWAATQLAELEGAENVAAETEVASDVADQASPLADDRVADMTE